ncbi:MAG: AAA family ATPase [Candidatus Peribacteraceae bacterium]|nr:AAA family ATPase [Candidatus Peribacteraceae bacterium]
MDFIPKNNIEAEESLLASLFIDNSEIDNCLNLIPDDFYKPAYQIVFKTILLLINKKEVADLVTVGHFINDNGGFETIGGAVTLEKIANSAPLSLNVKHHAGIIKDCSLNRNILTTALKVVDMCRKNKTTIDLLSFAQNEFLQIENKDMSETIHNVKDIVGMHIDRIEKSNTTQDTGGISTGFPVIDKKLSVKEGKLIIIAGRPKMGKSSLAVTIAHNMDRSGIKTGFLSLEMPESEIMDKLIAFESNIDTVKFGRYKGLNQNEYQELSTAGSSLSRSQMLIDGTGNLNFNQIAQRCRKMVKEGVRVIFIDQLSQFKGINKEENRDRFLRFSENVNRCSLLKKELKIPIFLLAQLSRNIEKRNDKEPIMSDLKMTGNLEEDADAIIFIYRPGVYEASKELNENERLFVESKTVLNLAANRSGGTVWTDKVRFNHKTQYFYSEI